MSNPKNTGGSAFPVTPENVLTDAPMGGGMTLRDYFAAKAMQGLLTATDQDGTRTSPTGGALGEICYHIADAMLKAREQ